MQETRVDRGDGYDSASLSGGSYGSSSIDLDQNEKDNAELTRTIKKAIRGDNEAFESLCLRYLKGTIYHARNLLVRPEDAEDAAQEAIIALHRNIGGLKSPYAFKSYLLKTIYSVCATRNRSMKQPLEPIEGYEEVLEDTNQLGPQGSLEQVELSQAIRSVIEQLPPKQREALTLRYFDDLEYEEIARLQGVTVNTVGTNILRAKKALKHLIEASEIEARGEAGQQRDGVAVSNQGNRAPVRAPKRDAGRIYDMGGPQTLRGVAIGPALALSTTQMINESVSAESVDAVIEGVRSSLVRSASSSGIGRATRQVKVLAGLLAAVLVIGGLVIAYQLFEAHTAPANQSAPVAPATYHPQAKIVFSGGNIMSDATNGTIEQINPTSATLVLDEGTPLSWVVSSPSGEELMQGSGGNIEGAFTELPPGEYTLTWVAVNDEGSRAHIYRAFGISS